MSPTKSSAESDSDSETTAVWVQSLTVNAITQRSLWRPLFGYFSDKNVNWDQVSRWAQTKNLWSVGGTEISGRHHSSLAMNCWTSSTASDRNDGHLCAGGSQSSSSSSPPSTAPQSQSKSTRVSTMSRVLDYLFISSARSITYSNINKYKITHIINATIEVPIIHLNGIKTIRIPVKR